MQDQELTGWFELSEQKPWEPGVYELSGCDFDDSAYSYWDGERFMYSWRSFFGVHQAWKSRSDSSQPHWFGQITRWRGLSSDPNAKPKPKRSGNPKVTRYVVTSDGDAVATFARKPLAEAYAKSIEKRRASVVWVETIRFRSPE